MLALFTFFLLVQTSNVALSSCKAGPQKKEEGEFKVTATKKVVFECPNQNSIGAAGKMSTSFCKIDAVAVKEGKKYKAIFVGEKGCSFKIGEIVKAKLMENYSCCDPDQRLTCRAEGSYKFDSAKDSKNAIVCASIVNWVWTDWE